MGHRHRPTPAGTGQVTLGHQVDVGERQMRLRAVASGETARLRLEADLGEDDVVLGHGHLVDAVQHPRTRDIPGVELALTVEADHPQRAVHIGGRVSPWTQVHVAPPHAAVVEILDRVCRRVDAGEQRMGVHLGVFVHPAEEALELKSDRVELRRSLRIEGKQQSVAEEMWRGVREGRMRPDHELGQLGRRQCLRQPAEDRQVRRDHPLRAPVSGGQVDTGDDPRATP